MFRSRNYRGSWKKKLICTLHCQTVTQNDAPVLKSSVKLPYKAQELLINIVSLESSVWNLEKELNELYYQLCHERNERLLAESKPGCLPSISSDDQSLSTCTCTWEEVNFLTYHH